MEKITKILSICMEECQMNLLKTPLLSRMDAFGTSFKTKYSIIPTFHHSNYEV